MKKYDFKNLVGRTAINLLESGYQIKEEETFYEVEFWKTLAEGVYCLIGFDLFQTLAIPYKFKVLLIRRRLEVHVNEESPYKPLIIDLDNLMLGLYNTNIYPTKQYAWNFTDEENLAKQIAHAQHFILEYGIKWLEDPMSNLNWVGSRRNNQNPKTLL